MKDYLFELQRKIVTVIHTTKAIVKLRPEKKARKNFRPERDLKP